MNIQQLGLMIGGLLLGFGVGVMVAMYLYRKGYIKIR
tara:strand:+ start:2706 stop:2816 length:111 start_codon:yes stop_codon:yes gene_type:complete